MQSTLSIFVPDKNDPTLLKPDFAWSVLLQYRPDTAQYSVWAPQ